MKKILFLPIVLFTLTFCTNNSDLESEESSQENTELSKFEADQKLIEACENMEGIINADIKDDILTIRANISKIEAQKLSDGMLSQIKDYNKDIKTVQVVDLEYQLLGYSGK